MVDADPQLDQLVQILSARTAAHRLGGGGELLSGMRTARKFFPGVAAWSLGQRRDLDVDDRRLSAAVVGNARIAQHYQPSVRPGPSAPRARRRRRHRWSEKILSRPPGRVSDQPSGLEARRVGVLRRDGTELGGLFGINANHFGVLMPDV